ncbi:hypothetical protein [Alteromonas gilva]|uniref:DUF2306 domain-containing protein n=1 Tax=Alteromonas gilva TaxID=2987522 RepID=A0ABT5L356_9ALTE|nr:hypothetical protein [Alteromonas gilva]MDC8830859.1 hypothetical protein [Alteromonas gilva]
MIDLSNWIHTTVGGVHVFASFVGLATGAWVIAGKKGTRLHKCMGYTFAGALLLVNGSAMFIYGFNQGSPSVFHLLVPVSLFFLAFGLYPMLFGNKSISLNRHIIGMTAAVYGLYAAGATEFFVREMAQGLGPEQLILFSFMISVPFAVAITVSIIYFQKKFVRKPR